MDDYEGDDLPIGKNDHRSFMKMALDLARQSPPKPTNFCVGAVIVNTHTGEILSTGYTLELEGNTHAEQCAIAKLLKARGYEITRGGEYDDVAEMNLVQEFAEEGIIMDVYTTMEPCAKRASGIRSCVKRIKALKEVVRTVYVGVKEPEIFVGENKGRRRLEEAGIEVVEVPGIESEILKVAKAGHVKKEVEI